MLKCQNCKSDFSKTPGSRGKFCSLSCGSIFNGLLLRQKKIENYNLNPKCCKNCNVVIPYEKKQNSFCGNSCAAKISNATKDYSKFKTGPKPGTIKKAPYTRVKQCIICKKWHPKKSKSCSKECASEVISLAVRGKTGGNRDINLPGVDCNGKKFYFDSNWEIMLSKSLDENNIFWTRPDKFILSDGRSYTPDFYLPSYDLYIDPKAKRPGYYRKSLLKVEMFEKEFNKKCLVISNQKFLSWQNIQNSLLIGIYRI